MPIPRYVRPEENPFSAKFNRHKVSNPNMLSEFGAGLARGTEGMIASVGDMAYWLGETQNDPELAQWGRSHSDYWQKQMMEGFEAPQKGMTLKKHPFIRSAGLLGEALPSVALGYLGGWGAWGGARAIGAVPKAVKFAQLNKLAQASISFAGTQPLGAVIGANMYREARDNGVDKSTASQLAMMDWIGESILEIVPLTSYLRGGSSVRRRFLTTGLQEGMEEVTQGVFSNILKAYGWKGTENLYEDIVDGVVDQFVGGFLAGGLMAATANPNTIENISGDLWRELKKAKVNIPYSDIETAMTQITGDISIGLNEASNIVKTLAESGQLSKMRKKKVRRQDQRKRLEGSIVSVPVSGKSKKGIERLKTKVITSEVTQQESTFDKLKGKTQEKMHQLADDALSKLGIPLKDKRTLGLYDVNMAETLKQEIIEFASRNKGIDPSDVKDILKKHKGHVFVLGGESTQPYEEEASEHVAVFSADRALAGKNPIIPLKELANQMIGKGEKHARNIRFIGEGLDPTNIANKYLGILKQEKVKFAPTDFIPSEEGIEDNRGALIGMGYDPEVAKAIEDVLEMIRTERGPQFLRSFKDVKVVFRMAGKTDSLGALAYWSEEDGGHVTLYADAIARKYNENKARYMNMPLPYVIARYMAHEYTHFLIKTDQKSLMKQYKKGDYSKVYEDVMTQRAELLNDLFFLGDMLDYKGADGLFGLAEEIVAEAMANHTVLGMEEGKAIQEALGTAKYGMLSMDMIDNVLDAYNAQTKGKPINVSDFYTIIQRFMDHAMVKAKYRMTKARADSMKDKIHGVAQWSVSRYNPVRHEMRNNGSFIRSMSRWHNQALGSLGFKDTFSQQENYDRINELIDLTKKLKGEALKKAESELKERLLEDYDDPKVKQPVRHRMKSLEYKIADIKDKNVKYKLEDELSGLQEYQRQRRFYATAPDLFEGNRNLVQSMRNSLYLIKGDGDKKDYNRTIKKLLLEDYFNPAIVQTLNDRYEALGYIIADLKAKKQFSEKRMKSLRSYQSEHRSIGGILKRSYASWVDNNWTHVVWNEYVPKNKWKRNPIEYTKEKKVRNLLYGERRWPAHVDATGKPRGVWLAVKDAWLKFYYDVGERPGAEKDLEGYSQLPIKLNPTAKIFVASSDKDIMNFTKKYYPELEKIPEEKRYDVMADAYDSKKDFVYGNSLNQSFVETLKEEGYDGIHYIKTSEGENARYNRFFRGWDIESAVIWNTDIIELDNKRPTRSFAMDPDKLNVNIDGEGRGFNTAVEAYEELVETSRTSKYKDVKPTSEQWRTGRWVKKPVSGKGLRKVGNINEIQQKVYNALLLTPHRIAQFMTEKNLPAPLQSVKRWLLADQKRREKFMSDMEKSMPKVAFDEEGIAMPEYRGRKRAGKQEEDPFVDPVERLKRLKKINTWTRKTDLVTGIKPIVGTTQGGPLRKPTADEIKDKLRGMPLSQENVGGAIQRAKRPTTGRSWLFETYYTEPPQTLSMDDYIIRSIYAPNNDDAKFWHEEMLKHYGPTEVSKRIAELQLESENQILDTETPTPVHISEEIAQEAPKKSLKDIELPQGEQFNQAELKEKELRARKVEADKGYRRLKKREDTAIEMMSGILPEGIDAREAFEMLVQQTNGNRAEALIEIEGILLGRGVTDGDTLLKNEVLGAEETLAFVGGEVISQRTDVEKQAPATVKGSEAGVIKQSPERQQLEAMRKDLMMIGRWIQVTRDLKFRKANKKQTEMDLQQLVKEQTGQGAMISTDSILRLKGFSFEARDTARFIGKRVGEIKQQGWTYTGKEGEFKRVMDIESFESVDDYMSYLHEEVKTLIGEMTRTRKGRKPKPTTGIAKLYRDLDYFLDKGYMTLKSGIQLFDEASRQMTWVPSGSYSVIRDGDLVTIRMTNKTMEQIDSLKSIDEMDLQNMIKDGKVLADQETGSLYIPTKEIKVEKTWLTDVVEDDTNEFSSVLYNRSFALAPTWQGAVDTVKSVRSKLDKRVSGRKWQNMDDYLDKEYMPQMRENGVLLKTWLWFRKKVNPILKDQDIIDELDSKTLNRLAPYKKVATQEQVNQIVRNYLDEKHLLGLAGWNSAQVTNAITQAVWKHVQEAYPTDDEATQKQKLDAFLTLMHLANEEILVVRGKDNVYRVSDKGMRHRWQDGQIKDPSKVLKKGQKNWSERDANIQLYVETMRLLGKTVSPQKINNMKTHRPSLLFWSQLDGPLQDVLLLSKNHVENTVFEMLLESGLLDRTDNEANTKAGFTHRFWVHRDEEHKQTRTKTYQMTKKIARHKYRTVAESVVASSTLKGQGTGLKAITNYAAALGDYINDSAAKLNQDDIIKKLLSIIPCDSAGLPSVVDKKGVRHQLAFITYEDEPAVKLNGEFRGAHFMEQLGYRQLKNAEGLIKRKGGAFFDPWVHRDVYTLLQRLYETKDQNEALRTLLKVNGMVKKNIMFSPYNFAIQIASSPMMWLDETKTWDWVPMLGPNAWNYVIKPLFWKGGLIFGGFKSFKEQQKKPDPYAHMKDSAYDPELVSLFVRHGARNWNVKWVNETLFDSESLKKHPLLQSEVEKTKQMLGGKFGVDDYVFNNYVGRVMYAFMSGMTRRFYNEMGHIKDPNVRKSEAARRAVAFANDTSGMIDKYIYGAEGPFLQAVLFARDFTMSFLRQVTGATYPLWKKQHKYRVDTLASTNSLLHGEKSKQDMEFMSHYYQAHLTKVVLTKFLLFSILQFGLSFWDDEDEDKEQGIWAPKRWMFKNEPGKFGMIRMPKVGPLRGKANEPLYLDPLLWREMSQMVTLIQRGPVEFGKGKVAWAPKTIIELMANVNYRGQPITDQTGAISMHQAAGDILKHVGKSALPTFVRESGRAPSWSMAATGFGMPIKAGATAKGDAWALRDMQKVVSQQRYWQEKKRDAMYQSTNQQLRGMMFHKNPRMRISPTEYRNEINRRRNRVHAYKKQNKSSFKKNWIQNR